jgi:hypothetical protein
MRKYRLKMKNLISQMKKITLHSLNKINRIFPTKRLKERRKKEG